MLELSHLLAQQGPFQKTKIFQSGAAKATGYYSSLVKWNHRTFCHFGFLSWSKNEKENQILLDQIQHWGEALGVDMIVGPIDGTTVFNYRYRLNNFDWPPFDGEPENTPQDVVRLEERGFSILEKYESIFVDNVGTLKKIVSLWKSDASTLNFVKIDSTVWDQESETLPSLIDSIFGSNPGYLAMPKSLMKSIFGPKFIRAICLKTSCLIYFEKQLVGFCFNYRKQNTVYLKTIGILPEFRQGQKGFVSLVRFVLDQMEPRESLVACMMRKGNLPDLLMNRISQSRTEYGLFARNT